MAKNTETVSVQEWVESAPLARIKRRELIAILDACKNADIQNISFAALQEEPEEGP